MEPCHLTRDVHTLSSMLYAVAALLQAQIRRRAWQWLVDGQGALGNGQRVLGSGVVMARVGWVSEH